MSSNFSSKSIGARGSGTTFSISISMTISKKSHLKILPRENIFRNEGEIKTYSDSRTKTICHKQTYSEKRKKIAKERLSNSKIIIKQKLLEL